MTISITNENGTDVHTDAEETLFVVHLSHDMNVALYIERVRSKIESGNGPGCFIHSFDCDSGRQVLDPPWKEIT